MCLPDFIEFKEIEEEDALVGYRLWNNPIEKVRLYSLHQNYIWNKDGELFHEVREDKSGIYAYNYYNYNNYNYNNYYNNYYNYYNYNYNYYNNYYNNYELGGIILQFGKVAVHKEGYRSESAKIKTLFTIRESDAKGDDKFTSWIKSFNEHVREVAREYKADTIHWQDFKEEMENKK